ncbi:hypothetical protein [Streptobacillus moniliformis]|uniref:hypothetical protein n=3 Tax=Streptobacillus moniliformis TaxID=34105 RepID=UPI0007E45EB2|nr:hypothetical protein [Streptobacillus moniliformis]
MNQKYINHKISAKINLFPLEQVNCFSRAFATCFSTYNDKLGDLYLMLDSFYNCYRIYTQTNCNIFFEKEILISKILDFNLSKISVNNNFYNIIEKFIELGFPVVIPVNLRNIYYSHYYLEEDWEHPFIIKGYDKNKKIFYILDNVHLNSENELEREFIIKYEILFDAYESYFNYIAKGIEKFILILEKNSNENIYISNEVYKNSFNFINENIKEIFSHKNFEELFNNKITKRTLNIYRYKDLFLNIYINLLKELNLISFEKYNYYIEKEKYLIKKWKKYNYSSYLHFLKNKNYPVKNSDYNMLIKYESDLWNCFQNESLFLDNNIIYKENTEKIIYIENNEDNIIYKNEKEIIFKFNNKKIYNTWSLDESPKIMYSKNKNFELWISIEVLYNPDDADFVAGLVVKNGNDIFYFGLDSEKRINIDLKREKSSIKEKVFPLKYIELGVKFYNKECNFMYKLNSKIYNLHTILFENECLEYGIGCKTYFYAKPLELKIIELINKRKN